MAGAAPYCVDAMPVRRDDGALGWVVESFLDVSEQAEADGLAGAVTTLAQRSPSSRLIPVSGQPSTIIPSEQ